MKEGFEEEAFQDEGFEEGGFQDWCYVFMFSCSGHETSSCVLYAQPSAQQTLVNTKQQ